MEGSLDMQAEDSGTSNLIREGKQGEVVTAEGMGTMPCQNTVTDATTGGTSTMTTAEQEFLERVMGIMDYARGHLSSYPSIREQIEYWNEIVEAWEEFTEKSFYQGDLEDEEWEKELEEGKS